MADNNLALLKALPTGLDPRGKRARKQKFFELDNNGNGIVSLAELDHALKNKWNMDIPMPVVARAFHAARDMAPPVAGFSNDYIDFSEFRVFMVYLQHYYDLYDLFTTMDASGDRRLGLDEFVQAVPMLRKWGVPGLENPEVAFQRMDTDGGGMVLFDEFAHWALQQGVSDLNEDATERAEALALLKNAEANLCSKEFDDMKHSKFSVIEGIQGQGALTHSDLGRLLLAGALGMGDENQMLVVNVHQANGLRIADRTTSDPFAELTFGEATQMTKTIKRNLNPIWDETLRFVNQGTDVEINIYDYDVMSANDFLGKVVLDAKLLASGKTSRLRLKLTGEGAQGTIDVSFKWQAVARRKTC